MAVVATAAVGVVVAIMTCETQFNQGVGNVVVTKKMLKEE